MKLVPSAATPSWLTRLKLTTIRCETCHHSMALRPEATVKAGIRMRDRWYCSARCFRSAAEQEVARLLMLRVEQPVSIWRMPLGLSLIQHELLTPEQLRKATDEQKETAGELGELLVRQGYVSEKQVTAIRAAVWGCPVFALRSRASAVAVNIPATLMREYSMVPVHYVKRTNLLLVGFVHSVEYGLLYAIEQMNGCSTKPCFVTASDFQLQIELQEEMQAQNAETPAAERSFEEIQTPAEIARILCTSGLEIEADQAFMERCKDYLWARLKSVPRSVDLLFRVG